MQPPRTMNEPSSRSWERLQRTNKETTECSSFLSAAAQSAQPRYVSKLLSSNATRRDGA